MRESNQGSLRGEAESEVEADDPPRLSFDQAYSGHVKQVLTWALRYVGGDRARAEELTQDVFAKLFVQFNQLNQNEDLARWLYRVTVNLAISDFRKEGRLWHRVKALLGQDERKVQSPAEVFEQQESALECERAIRSLPGQQRVLLWMKLVDGRSQRDIARELELSEGQVSKLISKGLATLKKQGFGARDES